MAVIDHAIGKKISYSPDFDTEVFNSWDCRALYKIISSGYGVCNGIASVERCMFERAGIECEMIGSENHSFLKVKNIELPLANGETIKGNTIVDPTWNLGRHRFDARPDNFCISYEQARKNDIDNEGKDHKCHKNDEYLQDTTLNLDEQSLRGLFASVGLAHEDGNFPAVDLLEKSEEIHETYANNLNEDIKQQFLLLAQTCPEFATCQNSTMMILGKLLSHKNLDFNKCVTERVFEKQDERKSPVLYVHIDSDKMGKKFFVADKNEGQFVELSQEKFEERFDCYQKDLELTNGVKPWETKEQDKKEINLATTSGTEVDMEGRE